MRGPGPMSPDEFANALDLARAGCIITDQGATEEVRAALEAVAAATPNPPPSLIDAARRAYSAQ